MRFGEKLKKVGAILTGLISVLSAAYLIAILWIEPIVFWEKSGIVWLVVTAVF